MEKSALLASLVALLLLGCVSERASPSQITVNESENLTAPRMPPGDGWEDSSPPPPPKQQNGTAMSPQDCTVQFQRGLGDTYYVMVAYDGSGNVSVQCPGGGMAERSGSVFFCETLSSQDPVRAFIWGLECGSAQFSPAIEAQSGERSSCSIVVSPKNPVSGDTLAVSVSSSTGNSKANLSYDCGAQEQSAIVSGIYSETKQCKFNQTSSLLIQARLNGIPCASVNVSFYPTRRGCSVQRELLSYRMEGSVHVYSGKVFGHGFSESEELAYRCGESVKIVPVRSIPSSADFEYTLECRVGQALSEPVRVTISKIECGSISPGSG